MSVTAMVRLVHERQRQDRSTTDLDTGPGAGALESVTANERDDKKSQHAVTTALERLTGFIPGEVVTAWGAAVGVLAPGPVVRWIVFGVAVGFLVAMLLMETAVRDKKNKERTRPTRQVLLVIVAVLAFTVWAFALPGSPAAVQWGEGVMRYFGVGAVALSALLYKGTQLLGLAPLEDAPKT